jgi:glutamate synthase (NADPH/NADH) small chain
VNDSLPAERLEQRLPDAKPLYSAAEAKSEADRCLYCADAPCIQACPTEIDVPTFIKKIASGNVRGAARTIFEQNMLGGSCARVCPVEVLCVGSCVYNGWNQPPIQIGRLQRYATEVATREEEPPLFRSVAESDSPGRKAVALVGAGPASLACAAELSLQGHSAVIFERRELPGGLNTSGVAPYKLHVEDALAEVDWIRELGVEIRTGVEIGKDLSGDQLLEHYDAVFLGLGTGADHRLGVPGEQGPGVVGASAWIRHLKLGAAEPGRPLQLGRVVVIGGGNTALDVARECSLLGAEKVTLVHRRGPTELTGYAHELAQCRAAGVQVLTELVLVAFLRDQTGKLHGIRLSRAVSGRPVGGTEHDMPCDLAVIAIGQSKLGALVDQFPGVEVDARGCIVASASTGATGNPRVFSGGDCANGGKEVVHAVADGRNAAREMVRGWRAN